MQRWLWRLRRPVIRTLRQGNVKDINCHSMGIRVLTATYVLEDTLYSIELLYTLWRLHCLTGFQRSLTTLRQNRSPTTQD
jgi:hypothetical protein